MFTKQETKQIQGIAILAMCCLHLFCTYTPSITSFVYVAGVPMVYFIGQASDFCVMAYCFCSGYGLMACYMECKKNNKNYFRSRCQSILKFLENYWVVLFIFASSAVLLGKSGEWLISPMTFIGNVFTLWYSYNGAWWFVSTYIVMVLFSPVVFYFVQKYPQCMAILSVFVYVISYLVRFGENQNFWIQHLSRLGMSYAELLIGTYFYKYRLMDRIEQCWKYIASKKIQSIILFIIPVLVIVTRGLMPTAFVAPISGIVFIVNYILAVRNKPAIGMPFLYLGHHSANIWLVHMFFYLPMYGGIAYLARYSLLVFVVLVGLSLIASYGINMVRKGINRLVFAIK